MTKPPTTPPHSDVGGVNRDGMRPSKPLHTPGDQSAEALDDAADGNAARPDYLDEDGADDRSR